jgi:hypothetical protein
VLRRWLRGVEKRNICEPKVEKTSVKRKRDQWRIS